MESLLLGLVLVIGLALVVPVAWIHRPRKYVFTFITTNEHNQALDEYETVKWLRQRPAVEEHYKHDGNSYLVESYHHIGERGFGIEAYVFAYIRMPLAKTGNAYKYVCLIYVRKGEIDRVEVALPNPVSKGDVIWIEGEQRLINYISHEDGKIPEIILVET